MLLKERETGNLVEIIDVDALLSPVKDEVSGRIQAGEEEQNPENFSKEQLIFPSGEKLPRCWIEADYKTN